MSTTDFETQLKQAATIAAPSRSIVDDVMSQLPLVLPGRSISSRWNHRALLAGMIGVAAIIVFVLLFTGSAVRFTLADVQAAVERQRWVHIRYDAGQTKDDWINLQTGERFSTKSDGNIVYINNQTNTLLWYWKMLGVIQQNTQVTYGPGQSPSQWNPRTAWDEFIAPLENSIAATRRGESSALSATNAPDTINGISVIRFDTYIIDNVGKLLLYSQLWADPHTHLPVRIKTRLQLSEREEFGKEWSTGDYEFPQTGPADVFALGVPSGTPVHKEIVATDPTVLSTIVGINHAYDNFLKNYRAIIWDNGGVINNDTDPQEVGTLDILWCDGDKVRQDHHLPPFELNEPVTPLGHVPAVLLAWAEKHEPVQKQLRDSEHEYSWSSASSSQANKPQVHVTPHYPFSLLATNYWPQEMQWPIHSRSPHFQLITTNAETPEGCIGLRDDGGGSLREDYYIDLKNDYICVKRITWAKRGTEWVKSREYTHSDLQRINGFVVAGTQHMHNYGVPHEYSLTTTINLVPLAAGDYPAGTFDATTLTTGANVIGY